MSTDDASLSTDDASLSRCCFGIVSAVLNVSGGSQLCGLVSGMSP